MAIASAYSASATIGLYGSKYDHVSAADLSTVGTIGTGSDADGDYIEAASQPGNRLVSGTVAKLSTTSGFTLVAKFKTTATGLASVGGTINDSLSYLENLVINQGDQTGTVLNGAVGLFLRGTDGLIRFGRTPDVGINDGDVHTVAIEYGGGGNTIAIAVDGVSQTVTYGDNSSPSVSVGNTQYPVFILARNVRGTADQGLAAKLYAYARLADDGFNLTDLSTDPSEIFDLAGGTAISFSGTVPTQNLTQDSAMSSLDLSTYFSGTETPFSYAVQTGTLPAGLSLNASTGVISGTPTAAGTASIVVRATDDATDTADTNSFDIVVASAVATVTVTDPLKNNTGTVLASETGVKAAVLDATTLESVYEVTGLTTNGSGVLEAISNAALTASTSYHVAIKLSDGSVGITGPITAT